MTKAAQFVTDNGGKKIAVVLSIKDYKKMLEGLEELEAIRAYDAAKAAHEKPVPYDKARARIERRRK
jgi:PHD/YefM family antitoxin component YafN of YafNO toxin-antitoxin module